MKNLLIVFIASLFLFHLTQSVKLQAQIDILLYKLQGKKVGFLTNPTGVNENLNQLANIIFNDKKIFLTCFFAPEHGLRGDQQDALEIKDYIDPYTGLPVYSLYGPRVAPTKEQLAGLDIVLFYIQDVGVRFYTFVWTMTYTMEACAQNNVEFIVFDRPDPIDANTIEGCPNVEDLGLFGRYWPNQKVGFPIRYGMTVGEVALLVNQEFLEPKADLNIIRMIDYKRWQYFNQTNLTWVMTSPNMPTQTTATVYPGQCLFEGSNLSTGRGTTRPFEIIGAPFINGSSVAMIMNSMKLPGVRFRPAYFQPTFDRYLGEMCGGVQVHVLDEIEFQPIKTGMLLLQTIYKLYPDQVNITDFAGVLFGISNFPDIIKNETVDDILNNCQKNITLFKEMRKPYLLY